MSLSLSAVAGYHGLKPKPRSPFFTSRIKAAETLSYLQPLSQEFIAKEIDYMLTKGWIPCLELGVDLHGRRKMVKKEERERSRW
ncbi:Ribulose bisphosphate carboxylase small subunit, chloroplastic [Linum perenne]